eukprot:8733141-Pyramimonas_sp.AAC.1
MDCSVIHCGGEILDRDSADAGLGGGELVLQGLGWGLPYLHEGLLRVVHLGVGERGQSDLRAEVVDVEVLLHVVAHRLHQIGQVRADHHVAQVPYVQRRVWVRRCVLNHHPLARVQVNVTELRPQLQHRPARIPPESSVSFSAHR